ncbi:MAG: DUF805 domain-containing protein [Gemmatimonadales bacterium]|jgi:uncharacterized membrane protein YhaH (DUF805 family)
MDPIDVLFSFEGRLNRQKYWLYQIGVGVVTSVPFLLGEGWLAGALELWAQAALSVKRAHDRGRSWKFVLLMLVPLVQLWPMFELFLLRGTVGENRFGPDPLARPEAAPRIPPPTDVRAAGPPSGRA